MGVGGLGGGCGRGRGSLVPATSTRPSGRAGRKWRVSPGGVSDRAMASRLDSLQNICFK